MNKTSLQQDNLLDYTEIIQSLSGFDSIDKFKKLDFSLDYYGIYQQQSLVNSQISITNSINSNVIKNSKSTFSTDESINHLTREVKAKNFNELAAILEISDQAITEVSSVSSLKDSVSNKDTNEVILSPEITDQVITYSGLVNSQADSVLGADRVKNAFPASFDGTGITIGVLSDSYNNLGGADDDIASGDLPAEGVTVIQDLSSGGSDEGRAMLQLIHDIAPGASLLFATAFGGQQSFADNIRALADAGADIIVDDVGYLTAPFFQDGIISQAVDDVVTNYGVAYFSSAGNSADIAYESTSINFAADTIDSISGEFYDFDLGSGVDTRQRITIPNNNRVRLSLQWDDPFYTNNGVDTDLDVFLVNGTTGAIVEQSTYNSIANRTPLEFLDFTNDTGQTNFDVLIRKKSGATPGRIKYIPFGLSSNPANIYQEYGTNSSTIFGHAAATNALAVGAVPYFNTNNPESFTSAGLTTILFEADGTPKATPEIRQKPEIAAIDGTDNTFFGSDIEGNSFPNFFGTSAAAPHAAAVAALVKEANPNFTPAQIYDRLKSTATDIGTPGVDNLTGAGLINAYDAIFNDYFGTATNDNFFADDRIDTINGNAGRDRLYGQGGNDIINGGDDDDFIQGGIGNDNISGDNGNDILYGNENNDTLFGSAGMDVLFGDIGDDFLDGEASSDRLLGGQGSDIFVLRAGDIDNIIYDFEDNRDFLGLADGLTSSSLTVNQDASKTEIFLDTDLLATLVNVTADVDVTDNFLSV